MLITRIATALVALPLVIAGILLLSTTAVIGVVALLMLLGAWEWGGLMSLSYARRAVFVVVVAVFIAGIETLRHVVFAPGIDLGLDMGSENLFIALACLWWLAAIYWITRFPRGWGAVMGRLDIAGVIGVIILAAPVAAAGYLHDSDQGPALLLLLCFVIWAADTGAYFAGRGLGRHKLAPRVSPNKTLEGAIGGIVLAVVIAALGAWALGYAGSRTLAFMVLGGWTAVMSIVGDLTISMFKRHAGRKDSGVLFPGHGGVLDRLDSFAAAAPWFVVGLHWLPWLF